MDAPENVVFPGLKRRSLLVVVRGRCRLFKTVGSKDRGVARVDIGLYLGKQFSIRNEWDHNVPVVI